MADKKISELTTITGSSTAADDYFVVVDTSGTATKKISRAELNNAIELDAFSTVNIDAGTIDGVTMATSDITVGSGKTLNVSAGTLTLADDQISGDKINGGSISSTFVGNLTGNVTGNASGTAATVTTAAQPAITSVGTLTGLGIGAAASAGKLHVTHTTGTIGYFESSQASANVSNLVGNSTQTNSSANLVLQVNGGTTAQALVRCNGDNSMAFFTGASPAERARLNATGLNIGGTTPVSPLTSEGDISIASTVDSDGGDLGEINFWNRTNAGSGSGTSFVNDVASIKCEMVGTGNNSGGSLKFFSKADGQSKTEALTITGDQKIGINDSTPSQALSIGSSGSATPTYSHANDGEGLHFQYNDDSGARSADIIATGNTPAGATQRIRFWANTGSGDGNASAIMTLQGDGKCGIGTAAPGRLLHLSAAAADTSVLRIESTGSHVAGVELLSGHGNWGVYNSDTVADALEFRDDSAAATRMIINSAGNVGVGTTAPSSALTVSGAIDSSPGVAGFHAGMSSNYAATEYSGSDGGFIDFQDASDGSDHSGRIIYAHSDDSLTTSTDGVQRFKIDGKGNVSMAVHGATMATFAADKSNGSGFSMVSPDGDAIQLYMLKTSDVEGHIAMKSGTDTNWYFGTGSGLGGMGSAGVYMVNLSNGWTAVSDERKKKNLVEIDDAVNKVSKLRAVTGHYLYDDDDHKKRPFLIAQDFVGNFPEAIDEQTLDDDGEKQLGLQYDAVIPLLVKALQESNAKIDALEARIKTLEGN
jgi:hypothetical protein